MIKIPIEISARHIHLSKQDLEKLFGRGYELKKVRELTQSSDFACQETLSIKSYSKVLENLRIVGPLREKTQVEISKTDAVKLGIDAPVRLSGDLAGSAGVVLVGPKDEVEIKEGVIIAKRHLHCAAGEAEKMGLKNGQSVLVKIISDRPVIFENVLVRVKDGYKLCLHLDTDEGNAAGIDKTGEGQIII